jgi:hypothetical protein
MTQQCDKALTLWHGSCAIVLFTNLGAGLVSGHWAKGKKVVHTFSFLLNGETRILVLRVKIMYR